MRNIVLLLILNLSLSLSAQEVKQADALVSPRIAALEISVGGADADVTGFDNQSIQFAIDALEKTGGTVVLSPGLYEISAPVRLKSKVHLMGTGKDCILKRARGVQTHYTVDADFGELKLTVENPDGFSIGMKVQVSDDENNGCWNVSTAYITDISENVIYIDKGLIRDYRSDLNGLVSNASSVIEVIEASEASVSKLVIDGNREENFFADGCNSAGILILKSEKIVVDKVRVKDFNGEGISWQITEHITIRNSEISGSGNTGLHPGTGSPFSIIENNDVHHNDRDGLFICWRVYQSKVAGNKFHHNGRFGLCTGHKDTDVLFENNHIFSNASDGVNLRGEREINAPHRNTFLNNTIENNGTVGGGYGFSINSPAKDLLLKENRFLNSAGTQKAAIYVHKAGLEPALENNQFDKHELGKLAFEKKEKEIILTIFAHPDDETTIGPVLAKYAEEHSVYLLFSTDGSFGVNDHSGIPAGDSLVEIRKKEAECSCAALGINPPVFLGIQDGMGLNGHGNFYEEEAKLKEGLLKAILEIQPTKIITFGPGGDTGHPDHRLLGAITTELLLREGLIDEVDLYYFSWTREQDEKYSQWKLNYADQSLLDVEISFEERHKEALISSIRCHKSQYSPEEMESWIAQEKADPSNVLYFRKFTRDPQKKTAF